MNYSLLYLNEISFVLFPLSLRAKLEMLYIESGTFSALAFNEMCSKLARKTEILRGTRQWLLSGVLSLYSCGFFYIWHLKYTIVCWISSCISMFYYNSIGNRPFSVFSIAAWLQLFGRWITLPPWINHYPMDVLTKQNPTIHRIVIYPWMALSTFRTPGTRFVHWRSSLWYPSCFVSPFFLIHDIDNMASKTSHSLSKVSDFPQRTCVVSRCKLTLRISLARAVNHRFATGQRKRTSASSGRRQAILK